MIRAACLENVTTPSTFYGDFHVVLWPDFTSQLELRLISQWFILL